MSYRSAIDLDDSYSIGKVVAYERTVFVGQEQQRQISLKEAGIKMEEGLHSLM